MEVVMTKTLKTLCYIFCVSVLLFGFGACASKPAPKPEPKPEPAKPIEPVKPAEPEKPIEPEEPNEPVKKIKKRLSGYWTSWQKPAPKRSKQKLIRPILHNLNRRILPLTRQKRVTNQKTLLQRRQRRK